MIPINFPESNRVLIKPNNMTDKECHPLPILNIEGQCISCWRVSFIEKLQILVNGIIWLRIRSGDTQPPVRLHTKTPFIKTNKETKQ